jgi:hypothetical protein
LVNLRAGTQDRGGMLMYYVPLQPGMYKTFGTRFDTFWCCTGTGSEEFAKLTDSIYFHDDAALYVNLFIPSRLDWAERGLRIAQTTAFPRDGRVTLTIESAPHTRTALKVRAPSWATDCIAVHINGNPRETSIDTMRYLTIDHAWNAGDIVTIDLPLTLHIDHAPDDQRVQAAMYGPLVLAAALGKEHLTASMIQHDGGPYETLTGAMPMPEVAAPGVWLQRAAGTSTYPIRFKSTGNGPIHTLVPLADIVDERDSIYLRNTAADA